jgi:hypothetical protein
VAAAAALGIAVCAAGAWLAWQAIVSPDVPFFTARAPAEWLIAPASPVTVARSARDEIVEFRGRFALAAVPGSARLRVRMYRSGSVELNGASVEGLSTAPGENWKAIHERDVAALLRAGDNELVLRARASRGPPAAWAALESDGALLVATDSAWTAAHASAAPEPARLATTPMSEWAGRPSRTGLSLHALQRSAPALAAFALASAVGIAALQRSRLAPGAWLLGLAAAALALLWWRSRGLDLALGFDAGAHLDYVHFILTLHSLPLADDGWAMYHPPLYYAAAAAVVALFGESGATLRALNAVGALVQCAALLGSLRILFPGRPTRVFAGFALGALVPMQLYLAQYVTNEVWAAALVSCAVWQELRILGGRAGGGRAHLALGALLGAALLTKFSALVAAAVLLAVLAGRLALRGERSGRAWLQSVGSVLVAMTAVAGWHYARVWAHFGSPLVGNWNAAAGPAWWQDPGYHTVWDYVRFGESLTRPVFSACYGCADGLYSTLWGDGLIGGMVRSADAPPWRWELMASGYWLALLPSLGVAIGFGLGVARLVRAPTADGWLLVGLAGATAFALLSLSLELPFYAQCKAFYGLSALVPFAAFGAAGLDAIASRLGRAAPALWILVGTSALCGYAAYWVS